MEVCFLRGLIVVLLIHPCTFKELSGSATPSLEAVASPQEAALSPGEAAPEVAPPSLKEVEEAVHEASELVVEEQAGGAEEVLKELLERAVEAALGEKLGGGGVGQEGAAAEGGAGEEVTEEVTGEVAEEQAAGAGDEVGGGEQVDVVEAPVEEVEAEGEAAAEEEAGGAGGSQEAAEESAPPAADPEPLQEPGASPEGGHVIGGELPAEEAEGAGQEAGATEEEEAGPVEQEEAGPAEREAGVVQEDTEEAPVGEVAEVEPEQETAVELDPGLEVVAGEGGAAAEAEDQGAEGEVGELPEDRPLGDSQETESTQSVVGEAVEEEGGVAGEGVVEEGVVEVGGELTGEEGGEAAAAGGEEEGGEVEEEVGATDQLGAAAGGEQEVAEEIPETGDPVEPEALPDPGETSVGEGRPHDHVIRLTPSLDGAAAETNVMGGDELLQEESNHANEIITSKDDLLNLDPARAEPTLDNFVEEIPSLREGAGRDEAEEQVEAPPEESVTALGLEAWKIGAITAAAFLLLETVVIVVYVLNCRNRNSAPVPERACEEACVEAEPTTGDCDDDTLPVDNGDTEQIAALDPSDLSQVLTHSQQEGEEEKEEEEEAAMTDIQLNSIEQSAAPDLEQDLRTSVL